MLTTIRVLVVDDHALVRAAIVATLRKVAGIECIGEATNGHEALLLLPRLQPDLVLMDMEMPVMNGWEATTRIVAEHRHVKVVACSMYSDIEHVLRALHHGASGYVAKASSPQDLATVLHAIARGELACSHEIEELLKQNYSREEKFSDESDMQLSPDKLSSTSLTPRQRQILRLLAESHSSKEIACLLGLKVRTVNSHRGLLMKRLGIHNTAGLVRYAVRQGVLPPEVAEFESLKRKPLQTLFAKYQQQV
jgi:DNA-binding NarL/FixJ family response regulator